MKKILLFIGFIWLLGLVANAQFIPNSNQAFQLAPAYNPAFTGVEGFNSVKIGYRSQWSSFPGAPRFVNVLGSARIQNAADVVHNALRVGTPINSRDIPKSKRIIHGLGGNLTHVSNGAQGIIENLGVGVTYALHFPLENNMFLSGGLAANYENIRVRWEKLDLADDDPLVNDGGGPFTKFNVRGGILLYAPKFYVHAAYYRLFTKVNSEPLTDFGYDYKGTAGFGVRFNLSATVELRPSVFAVMDQFNNIDIEYAAKLYYGEKAWGGFSYRDSGFAALILGFEFNSLVGISYSYEISTGGLQGFNNGSNEFILALKLANLRKLSPAVW